MTRTSIDKHQNGVTILEAVVAIFVIMVGLISALALIISSIAGARTSKNQLIAGNLARQAIEVVHAKRDTNWLKIESGAIDPSEWDKELYGNGSAYTAILNFQDDIAQPDFMKWNILYGLAFYFGDPEPLVLRVYQNDRGGWKVYNQYIAAGLPPGAVYTGFRLALSTKPICSDESIMENGFSCESQAPPLTKIGIQVKATVKWLESGIDKTYEQEERIYNWK